MQPGIHITQPAKIKPAGRFQLLAWVNDALALDYSRVEDCADGIAYAQLVESVLPSDMRAPLNRFDFSAQFREDRVRNLKVLSAYFKRVGISKEIDVEGIARAKFQENIEFSQWVYTFVQTNMHNAPPAPYRALERRLKAIEQQQAATIGQVRLSPPAHSNLLPNEVSMLVEALKRPPSRGHATGTPPQSSPEQIRAAKTAKQAEDLANLTAFLEQELAPRLQSQLVLQQQVVVAARERDILFKKLSQVEAVCQHNRSGIAKDVLQAVSSPPPPVEELLLELL